MKKNQQAKQKNITGGCVEWNVIFSCVFFFLNNKQKFPKNFPKNNGNLFFFL